MKRHALDPALRWKPAKNGEVYRVAVRNEDTGEHRTIYTGLKPTCRLPSEYRATSDQLSFRVEARPEADPDAPFRRIQEFIGIDRLGDDFTSPAPDLLSISSVDGAPLYRLVVREARTEEILIDFCRNEPKFLLPGRRLLDRRAEWAIGFPVGGSWTMSRWRRVLPSVVNAALARAARPVELPRPVSVADVNDAPWRPGRAPPAATDRQDHAPRLLITVDVTAAPALASRPDPASVVEEQWFDGGAGGATFGVAQQLERNGLRGLFFLDVFAGEVLGHTALAAFARRLEENGHGLGLMVRSKPWLAAAPQLAESGVSPPEVLARALEIWRQVIGAPPTAVKFWPGLLTTEVLLGCRAAGIAGMFFNPSENRSLPRWMRSRTMPFAALDGLAAFPVCPVVSTPAHIRDRILHHTVSNKDPLMAAGAWRVGQRSAHTGAAGSLITVHVDPLALLAVRKVRSASEARVWNQALETSLPTWVNAGWSRPVSGFDVADFPNEIAGDVLESLLAGLASSDLEPFDMEQGLSISGLQDAAIDCAFQPLLEERRGPHIVRMSAVRSYDNAYRMALSLKEAS